MCQCIPIYACLCTQTCALSKYTCLWVSLANAISNLAMFICKEVPSGRVGDWGVVAGALLL